MSARFRFPHSWLSSVSFCLGALRAPKLDSDAGGVVWVDADGWEQGVSARFRFPPLFVEVCVCCYLGALSAPKTNADTGGGFRDVGADGNSS